MYRSIGQTTFGQRPGTVQNYKYLEYQDGFPIVQRNNLLDTCKISKRNCKDYVSFIQMTDVHVIDATSPGRAAFLNQYVFELAQSDPDLAQAFSFAFRPYDFLSYQVVESMIQQINKIKVGPVSGMKV